MCKSSNTDIRERLTAIRHTIPNGVTLVCVSKFHPESSITEAYRCGERDFAESRVQELCRKQETLPKDIRWHMIGHLQTNKVRQIVPFIYLIQSVDSMRLLETINNEAARIKRIINVLLEVHTAKEEAKTGFKADELAAIKEQLTAMTYIHVKGLMTMATNTDDVTEIRRCFKTLCEYVNLFKAQDIFADGKPIISMGMSDDYQIAIEEGANMVRIGSSIFGERQY